MKPAPDIFRPGFIWWYGDSILEVVLVHEDIVHYHCLNYEGKLWTPSHLGGGVSQQSLTTTWNEIKTHTQCPYTR